MSESKYQILPDMVDESVEENELLDVSECIVEPFCSLKVLFKEEAYECVLPKGSKVLDLKEIIEEKSTCPASRQRFVYKGKVLKEDDCLSQIESGSCVHLFPLPVSASTILANAPEVSIDNSFSIGIHRPEHLDPTIQMSSREVYIWNCVLVISSATYLLDNVSNFWVKGFFFLFFFR